MVKNLNTIDRGTKVRLGRHHTDSQAENTIVINASDTAIPAQTPGALYLKPVRLQPSLNTKLLGIAPDTFEIVNSNINSQDVIPNPMDFYANLGNTLTTTIQYTADTALITEGRVGISNATPVHTLDVGSNLYVDDTAKTVLSVTGGVEIQGNLDVKGQMTVIDSQNLRVQDAIIEVGKGNATADVGVMFDHQGSNVFVGYKDDELVFAHTQSSADDTTLVPNLANPITAHVHGYLVTDSNVGIANNAPVHTLDVGSNLHVDDTSSNVLYVRGTSDFDGLIVARNDLRVVDNAYVSNNLTVFKDLHVTENVYVTNDIYALDNVYVSNTLNAVTDIRVTENAYVSNNLTVTKDIYALDNVYVSNTLNAVTDLRVTENAYVSNNLTVTKDIYALDNVYVSNTLNAVTDLRVTENAYVSNNLTVTKDLRALDNVYASKDVTVTQDLHVLQNAYVTDTLTSAKDIVVTEDLTVVENAYVSNNLTVTKDIYALDNVYVSNTLNAITDLRVTENAYVSNNLTVTKDIYVTRDVQVSNTVTISKDLVVQENARVTRDLTILNDLRATKNAYVTDTLNTDVLIARELTTTEDATITRDLLVSNVLRVSKNVEVTDTITGPRAVFDAVSVGDLTQNKIPVVGPGNFLEDSYISRANGSIVVSSDFEVLGNILVAGNSYSVDSENLVISDRIIGIAANNVSHALDIGIIMEHPGKNVALIHHGEATPGDPHDHTFTIGYTQNTVTDNHVIDDSNLITVEILGNLITQNTLTVNGTATFNDDIIAASRIGINEVTPAASLDVNGDILVQDTTDATSITTGALRVAGGVGVSGNVHATRFIGDGAYLSNIASNLQQITDNGNVTSNTVQFLNDNTALITVGRVGVSTPNPDANLHVTGNVHVDGELEVVRIVDATSQSSIRIGSETGVTGQYEHAIAIGTNAGNYRQRQHTVAIGSNAGSVNQLSNSVAIGTESGMTDQGINTVAIGLNAGKSSQGNSGIAIGDRTATTNQGSAAIAIGRLTGESGQGIHGVAIGPESGKINQGSHSIAIGYRAGTNTQGSYAIAIGHLAAGTGQQASNSIVINASSTALRGQIEHALYVNPIREVAGPSILMYNPTTKEVLRGNTISGSLHMEDTTEAFSNTTGSLTLAGGLGVLGNVHATTYYGDGSKLTGLVTKLSDVLDNGNVSSNTILLTNATTGLVASGNVEALRFIGDGAYLSNIASNLEAIITNGNATSGTVLFENETTGIVATSNIVAARFIGDGAYLSNIASNLEAIITNGNATSGTVLFENETTGIVATSNIVAARFIGDGAYLSNIASNLQDIVTNGNVTSETVQFDGATAIVATGNVGFGGNVAPQHDLSVGSNLWIDDASPYKLTIDGNAIMKSITLDSISLGTVFPLQSVTNAGNETNTTVEFTNTQVSFITSGNVGFGNVAPEHDVSVGSNLWIDDVSSNVLYVSGNIHADRLSTTSELSVGSNLHIDDTGSNVLSVTGNIVANKLTLGVLELIPSYGLGDVSNVTNTTVTTVEFNNPTTSFVAASNVGIGTTDPKTLLHVNGGMITNSDGFGCKRYSYSNTLVNQNFSNVTMTFASNTFCAKITAQLTHGNEEVSTLVFNTQGGTRNGTLSSLNIAPSATTLFGNTNGNPWNAAVGVTPTKVILEPSATGTTAYGIDLFVEYLSSSTAGKLESISIDDVVVKSFVY